MDIATFRTFLAAALEGSFAAAAVRVNTSASSATERIKQLEARIGARLFDRDKRGCRLTPAGQKFVPRAQQAVRAWEIAQHEVGLPANFERSLAFGGQYVLWNRAMMNWLAGLQQAHSDLALRVTAGASARLNRDLAEGFLDMAVLYDPIFRKGIGVEPLFSDTLILVSGGDPASWRDDYVRIEWGHQLGVEITARLNLAPQAGLMLDLGARSADWLIDRKLSGFMPASSIARYLASGNLVAVENVPSFDFPAYVCWRRDFDEVTVGDVISSIKQALGKPAVS